jgi:hypothetical protein
MMRTDKHHPRQAREWQWLIDDEDSDLPEVYRPSHKVRERLETKKKSRRDGRVRDRWSDDA